MMPAQICTAAKLAAAAALMLTTLVARPSGSFAAEVCFTPQSLRYAAGNELVNKGVRGAYVPLPHTELAPAAASFRPVRGNIRRVNLPPGAPKLIALTFDLCEQPFEVAGYQGTVVDFLRDNGIKATFFAGGKWMLTHSTRAQQLMSDDLFDVGNHTWGHRNLRIVSDQQLQDEIRGAQSAYEMVRTRLAKDQCLARDGKTFRDASPARMSLFRFPFGACNAKALDAVSANGLRAIQWDISSGDPDRRLTAVPMAKYVIGRAKPGSIILFHANGRGWATPEALPEIVAGLKQRGFQFVTVSELLRYPGARWEVTENCYDSRPGDTDHYDTFARDLEVGYQRFNARYEHAEKKPDASNPFDGQNR
jgi:peptidoglycan-N-acetylglucosamine deacetylase